ncbi:aspartate/glutamate racemase family protein [Cryptosporangium arvum]|uniref:Hydantoin racemase n=1 Tax=Cryptosporangium arvum DSM 44712 TaxID=927661 RepID=A0A011AHY2_9ACTN|nr:aspartate/glutamate racemase family protein [Cryptosporangium arvum]EXG81621.1 hydantoin racemase [Cryptosporangium arvum DSM 44712]
MRIYAVTPLHVGAQELARRQERYDWIAPDGVVVDLHDLPFGAPMSLETPADMRSSERYVVEALAGAPAGYDAVMPDCVLDPGVAAMQADPAFGIVIGVLRVTVAHAAAVGETVAAVVRNTAIADEMRAVVDGYGWGAVVTPVRTLDLDFAAVADGDRWRERLAGAAAELAGSGAAALINGCSAVGLGAAEGAAPIPVVDPVIRTLRLVAAGAAA